MIDATLLFTRDILDRNCDQIIAIALQSFVDTSTRFGRRFVEIKAPVNWLELRSTIKMLLGNCVKCTESKT